jgi:hypothetical protein
MLRAILKARIGIKATQESGFGWGRLWRVCTRDTSHDVVGFNCQFFGRGFLGFVFSAVSGGIPVVIQYLLSGPAGPEPALGRLSILLPVF